MDAEYREIRDENAEQLPFLQSLYILTTVVSTCRAGEITVDAGTKALAVNGPMPDHLLGIPAGANCRFWGDEHGTITLPPGTKPPRTGARILIPATHCDPTVNLHPAYRVVTNEGPLSIWPIVGRYIGLNM
jgi:D-serine deaminase-like pyridoxal phosphate-dependent protein